MTMLGRDLWNRRGRATTVVLAAGLLVLGCGDDDGDDTAGTTAAPGVTDTTPPADDAPTDDTVDDTADDTPTDGLDVCALVADVDVAAILGEPVGDPALNGSVCSIAAVAADSTAELNVRVDPSGGTEAFDRQRELLGSDAEISGLGDQAFSTGTWVHVVAGETYLYVQGVPNPLSTSRLDVADLESAAAQILTALG